MTGLATVGLETTSVNSVCLDFVLILTVLLSVFSQTDYLDLKK